MNSFDPETLTTAGFPTISYDTLQVRQPFRSDDRLIRPQDVETYAFAVEDYDPLFFQPGPFGGPVAHPTLLANQALFLRHNHYVVPAGLHARMIFDFAGPISLGTRARTVGQVVDKYVRRDKPYMVTEYQTRDENGAELVLGRFVQMLFSHDTAPAAGSAPKPEPTRPQVDLTIRTATGRAGTIEVGEPLRALRRRLDQRQIDAYSGVKPKSIHTDLEWARAKGFRTTIAQGMMSSAYVSALMTDAFGHRFVVGGKLDVRFLRPVYEGDELSVSGTVTGFGRVGEGVRAHVDVQVSNQLGEVTLAGAASALTG